MQTNPEKCYEIEDFNALYNMILLAVGLFISFVYSVYILPLHAGLEPLVNPTVYPVLYRGIVIIPYNKSKAIHLHHWIIYLFICGASIFGLFIQGLSYKDRLKFICRNPYK